MTTLYRIFGRFDERDKDGFGLMGTRLLYVGITDDYDRRMLEHSEKHWWASITKITRQEFQSRVEAAAAERLAIQQERPVHNKALNSQRQPAAAVPKPTKHAVRDPYLTLQEAADYLGVCTKSLRRYIRQGDVAAVRIKGSRLIRVRQSSIDALLRPIPSVKAG